MKKLVLVFVFLCVLAGSFVLYLKISSAPVYDGVVGLNGLRADVRVVRDQFGIPHISAQNQQDLYKAFGYVIASDRLFQIQMYKRLASGRLSEVLGKPTVPFDTVFRVLQFKKYADDYVAHAQLNPEMMTLVESYLDGINQYIQKGPWPVEFSVLQFDPEPVSFADMIAFSGYMAYSFASAHRTDAFFGSFTKEQNQFARDAKESFDIPLVSFLNLNARDIAQLINILPSFEGSNSWVVAPDRSESGKALLANDPHIGFSNPGIWYEAHLKTPDFELYGNFLSIIPFALVGHNKKMAWALTMSDMDDLDLYQEKIEGDDVYFKNKLVPLEKWTEQIHVRFSDSVDVDLVKTPHGPIVDTIVKSDMKNLQNISMRWLFYELDNHVIETFYLLNRAQNIEDYKLALQKGRSPGLNISYADQFGNIAWWIFGDLPIRSRPQDHNIILRGDDGSDEWLGLVPFDDKPHAVNPKSGLIVSANQKPPVKFNDKMIKGNWEPSDRYETLYNELVKKDKWSLEEFKTLHLNDYFWSAGVYKELIVSILYKQLQNQKESAPLALQKFQQEVKVLETWDQRATTDSIATGLFYLIIENFVKIQFDEKHQMKLTESACFSSTILQYFKKSLDLYQEIALKSVHNVSQEANHQLEQAMVKAFIEAVQTMRHRYGQDINNWAWGKIHTLTFNHALGKVPVIGKFFNIGPFEVPGGYMIPHAQKNKFCEPNFNVLSGPSTRRLIDFYDIEKTQSVLPIGISGNIFSPFYNDQVRLFINGEYRLQLMNEQDIEQNKTFEQRFVSENL